jgi:NADH-quinone oxidoreductase subunit J
MTFALVLLGALTLACAAGCVFLRNLVHAALCLAAALAGLAGLYLILGAQFLGLAQILVYVGAVAVIILFAVLLTRGSEPKPEKMLSFGRGVGLTIALAVLVLLCSIYGTSELLDTLQTATPVKPEPPPTVRELGAHLMQRHALSLQALGLLLTAALIGGVLLAMRGDTASGGSSREREGTQL